MKVLSWVGVIEGDLKRSGGDKRTTHLYERIESCSFGRLEVRPSLEFHFVHSNFKQAPRSKKVMASPIAICFSIGFSWRS